MVGFGGIVSRKKVKLGADVWVEDFTEKCVISLLAE
jgi:hypothetical protein